MDLFLKIFRNKYLNNKIWRYINNNNHDKSKRYDELNSISILLSIIDESEIKDNNSNICSSNNMIKINNNNYNFGNNSNISGNSFLNLLKYKIKRGDHLQFDLPILKMMDYLSRFVNDDREFYRCLASHYKVQLLYIPHLLETICRSNNLLALEEFTKDKDYKVSKAALDYAIQVGDFKVMDFLFKNRDEGYTEKAILQNIFFNYLDSKLCTVFAKYAIEEMKIDLSKCSPVGVHCYYLCKDQQILDLLYENGKINFEYQDLFLYFPLPRNETLEELLHLLKSFLLILKRYVYIDNQILTSNDIRSGDSQISTSLIENDINSHSLKVTLLGTLKNNENTIDKELNYSEKDELSSNCSSNNDSEFSNIDDEFEKVERPPIEDIEFELNGLNFSKQELESNILEFSNLDKRVYKLLYWYCYLLIPYGIIQEGCELVYHFILKYQDVNRTAKEEQEYQDQTRQILELTGNDLNSKSISITLYSLCLEYANYSVISKFKNFNIKIIKENIPVIKVNKLFRFCSNEGVIDIKRIEKFIHYYFSGENKQNFKQMNALNIFYKVLEIDQLNLIMDSFNLLKSQHLTEITEIQLFEYIESKEVLDYFYKYLKDNIKSGYSGILLEFNKDLLLKRNKLNLMEYYEFLNYNSNNYNNSTIYNSNGNSNDTNNLIKGIEQTIIDNSEVNNNITNNNISNINNNSNNNLIIDTSYNDPLSLLKYKNYQEFINLLDQNKTNHLLNRQLYQFIGSRSIIQLLDSFLSLIVLELDRYNINQYNNDHNTINNNSNNQNIIEIKNNIYTLLQSTISASLLCNLRFIKENYPLILYYLFEESELNALLYQAILNDDINVTMFLYNDAKIQPQKLKIEKLIGIASITISHQQHLLHQLPPIHQPSPLQQHKIITPRMIMFIKKKLIIDLDIPFECKRVLFNLYPYYYYN